MAALPYDKEVDTPILAVITESSPIQFALLLRELELRVGHNRMNAAFLIRRLKRLRVAGLIRYCSRGHRGWVRVPIETTEVA